MKIHEFQAKETLKKFGVPVQDGIAIKSMNQFDDTINQLQQRGITSLLLNHRYMPAEEGKVNYTILKITMS